jgi:hypothetical protein
MKLGEIVLNSLKGTVEEILESKLESLLDGLHDKDPDLYRAAVIAGNQFVRIVAPLADRTKTPLDNALFDLINDAIKDSAKNNNVEL